MTRGEQPTVFSLKSRRTFPARLPLGGEYGAMFNTALRGSGKPHLHRSGMRFEAFGAGESSDGGCELSESSRIELLGRDHLDVVGGGEAAAQTRDAAGGQNVIGSR